MHCVNNSIDFLTCGIKTLFSKSSQLMDDLSTKIVKKIPFDKSTFLNSFSNKNIVLLTTTLAFATITGIYFATTCKSNLKKEKETSSRGKSKPEGGTNVGEGDKLEVGANAGLKEGSKSEKKDLLFIQQLKKLEEFDFENNVKEGCCTLIEFWEFLQSFLNTKDVLEYIAFVNKNHKNSQSSFITNLKRDALEKAEESLKLLNNPKINKRTVLVGEVNKCREIFQRVNQYIVVNI